MNVFVALKTDRGNDTEIIGVFATLEVAKTVSEAEEPDRKFEWDETFGLWNVWSGMSPKPVYDYSIEELEVIVK